MWRELGFATSTCALQEGVDDQDDGGSDSDDGDDDQDCDELAAR